MTAHGSGAPAGTDPEALPLPPIEVARRSGSLPGPAGDPYLDYRETGAACKAEIAALLERADPGWSWEGKRVLDFGCGAGRTLRNFATEADAAGEFAGCDIYSEGVEWVQANLSPPFSAFASSEAPPLDRPDGSFDLIYALSVFTHITDEWSRWLVEMRRLLAPGGLLLATFVGNDMTSHYLGGAEREDVLGMCVLLHDNPWESGGPLVLHSDWWLRSHWGRGFEVLEVDERPEIERAAPHRWWLFRKLEAEVDAAAFERVDADHAERERIALEFNRTALQRELEQRAQAGEQARADLARRTRRAEATVRRIEGSRSWRLTAPIREIRGRGRGQDSGPGDS